MPRFICRETSATVASCRAFAPQKEAPAAVAGYGAQCDGLGLDWFANACCSKTFASIECLPSADASFTRGRPPQMPAQSAGVSICWCPSLFCRVISAAVTVARHFGRAREDTAVVPCFFRTPRDIRSLAPGCARLSAGCSPSRCAFLLSFWARATGTPVPLLFFFGKYYNRW